ncbi:MAG: 4'-phosphopantetheinyl transferase superfamily protein [Lachnospiraceae bacterium]|nr:4'-phosphopantetheinyl transferase superfamily protein [Lachnospiraceae bacterium]
MPAELYLIHTGFLQEEETFLRQLKRVSRERKERVEACRIKADKLRCLAGGLLLEELLRQNFHSPEELVREEKGRLVLPGQESFFFNLSHSGDYAACVVADFPVGVDIQQFRPIQKGLAKRFFQPQEAEHIHKHTGKNKEELFFRYWSAKESYSKLIGEGLGKNFNSFAVRLEEGRIEDKRELREIYLKEYFCLPEYSIAVSAYEKDFQRFVKKIIYRL